MLNVAVLEGLRESLGGGNLSLWLILGALVAVWLAVKAVKLVIKLVFVGAGAAMLLATAPWAGAAIEGPAADCAIAAVSEASTGWETNITKRITVEELTEDAACDGATGLRAGGAVVKLRSFFDVPFQTWDVTADGAVARSEIPQVDIPLPSGS